MALIQSLTRQLSSLDIQNPPKPNNPQSVSKLLTKFASPNPFNPVRQPKLHHKPGQPSSKLNPHTTTQASLLINIGKYDGGLECDLNGERGRSVCEAAQDFSFRN